MTDYPHDLDVRPLTTWPGQLTATHKQRRSPFSAPLGSTLSTLRTELASLSARHPILEVAIPPEQFRLDGRPRADARAVHAGVVLSLPTTSVGPLRYATDTFDTWQSNLRAIALGLEALRRVDRYGITRRGEQYTGFRALPPGGIPMPAGAAMDIDTAYTVLADAAGVGSQTVRTSDPGQIRDLYRKASRRVHPDAGGSTAEFQRLQEAMRVIDAGR